MTDNGYIDFTGTAPRQRFFVKDYLGNVRSVTDGNGNVLEEFDYAPFGEIIRHYKAGPGANDGAREWRFSANELLSEFGDRIYDFQARFYSPYMGRFYSMDPLCEKYYDISPYAYCNNNPFTFVDPEGEKYWIVNQFGRISCIDNDSEEVRLYYTISDGSVSDDYVNVSDDKVLENLQYNNNKKSYTSKLTFSAAMELFVFLSDHSNIEWALHALGSQITLGTVFKVDSAGDWIDFGHTSTPALSIHSHPSIIATKDREIDSMSKDYQHIHDPSAKKAKNFYVYFPESKRVYVLNKQGTKSVSLDYFKQSIYTALKKH